MVIHDFYGGNHVSADPHDRPKDQLADRRLEAQVIELKDEGLTFEQIGQRIGRHKSQAQRIFHRAMKNIPVSAMEEYRANQLARLALARESVMDVLGASHLIVSQGRVVELRHTREDGSSVSVPLKDHGPVLAAVDRLLKIDEQEAKLLNLYPDVRYTMDAIVNYTVTGIDVDKLR